MKGRADRPPILAVAPDAIPCFIALRWTGRRPAMWMRGNAPLLERPLAAVIGTRHPSDRGRAAARRWALELVRLGGVVVSGGAVGIDQEAHRGALESGGATVVVPPCGLGIYEPSPWFRARANAKNHLLCTNLEPREETSRSTPVRRNALVAALADVVIVVETPPRSGTAYVVNHVRRRNGPILAIEFRHPAPPAAEGNAALITAGALALPEHPTRGAIARLSTILRRAYRTRPARDPQPQLFTE